MTKKEKKVNLLREKEALERQQPALKKGFFEFVESFRKYKEMRKQVVGEKRRLATKVKR